MQRPVRILGVAPYEGMKSLMEQLAASCENVQLTTYVGDLEKGVEIAQRSFHENFDLIISRGGTAQMIQKYVSLPVVEIEISLYDIFCALKLSEPCEGKVAIVGFPSIMTNAHLLRDLVAYKVDIFTIQSVDEVEQTLRRIWSEGYRVMLCDMITNTTAKHLGLNTFLITSGMESVRDAFHRAVGLYESYLQLREEIHFLRDIIRGQSILTVVLDGRGELFFSSAPEDLDQKLFALLRSKLSEISRDSRWHALHSMGGILYSIFAQRLSSGGQEYVAFYISTSKIPFHPNRCGIRFFSRQESEEQFYDSIYSVSGAIGELQDTIGRLNRSALPVLISGEDGTGKEQVASVLYTTSKLGNRPLVRVDCALLDDKSWNFLLDHYNSPLSGAENTLYFKSVDLLPYERRKSLLATLQDMDVCRRNRVIFSCVCKRGETITEAGAEFVSRLCCLSLHLPPLRDKPERIPPLVNMRLNHLNVNLARQILSVEPEALRQIRDFSWPHNYTQLNRVLTELSVTAGGQIITAEDVYRVLKKERNTATLAPQGEDSSMPLDLNRTLDEINRDVIRRVLHELGENRSATAQRLGISRTTLWRLLQEK